MISHHPDIGWLQAFAAGELPTSLALAVALHLEACPACQQQVHDHEAWLARNSWHADSKTPLVADLPTEQWDAIFESIVTQPESLAAPPLPAPPQLQWQGQSLTLPRALRHLTIPPWQRIGKIGRARLALDGAGPERTSLLAIAPGTAIPEHSHPGYEVTVVLAGGIEDQGAHLGAGEFLLWEGAASHAPRSAEGCFCLTVMAAPLRFTRGWARLLNGCSDLLY